MKIINSIKPRKSGDITTTSYSKDHWTLLKKLRYESLSIISALKKWGIEACVHGSVARGDVDELSDLDIIVKKLVSSTKMELALREEGFKTYSRRITQATPSHALKGRIYLDLNETRLVTFPLTSFRTLELEFYKFGGLLYYNEILSKVRTPGCTKRLTLIKPTETGHIEFGIIGREAEVSKLLKVRMEIIKERERVLLRRDKVGRTGIFINKLLEDEENFESVLKSIVESNPAVRRLYAKREKC